ncbi:MAG: tRNA 2-selenouridine(34) synthase MnmH [Deferribacterota bacterium]|nr:tRNA 2-selenouridine(34) synthase MnmH [Deferribacterota bacterium]
MILKTSDSSLINIDELIDKGFNSYTIIDVRSPSEFFEDHLPTAVNIPILNDYERDVVGKIYVNESHHKARITALRLIQHKLADTLEEIISYARNKPLLLYCFRGGDRSKVVQNLLGLLYVNTVRLHGGYKSFRKKVFNYFEDSILPQCITLYGPTGCGKTKILRLLEEENIPLLDLEGAAAHKGSNFGHIGEDNYQRVTQKNFESALWYSLYKSKFPKVVFVEGESKRIGKVSVPKRLFQNMRSGINVYIDRELKKRVDFIIQEYKPQLYKEEIIKCFDKIKRYMSKNDIELLRELLCQNRFYEFSEKIILDYYDPLYEKSYPKNISINLNANNLSEVVDKLKDLYKNFV